jgi:hypothetical protein
MSSENEQNIVSNVDETINNDSVQEAKTKKVQLQVFHWTELKTCLHSCEREMLFPEDVQTGFIKAVNCNLVTTKTASGEKSQTRFIQFDQTYLKYQVVALLRDLLFECTDEDYLLEGTEFDSIKHLIADAIEDFQKCKSDLIDNADTIKAIKPKDVTQALKLRYKP